MFEPVETYFPARKSQMGQFNLHESIQKLHSSLVNELEQECKSHIESYKISEERQALAWKLFTQSTDYSINPYHRFHFEKIHEIATDVLMEPDQTIDSLFDKYSSGHLNDFKHAKF